MSKANLWRWLRCLGVVLFWLFSLSITAGITSPAAAQPAGPRLLLTEIYYDTPGRDADEEWVELANLGDAQADLSGYALSDALWPGSREGAYRFPEGTTLPAGEVLVVAVRAAGFRALFGRAANFEMVDSDPNVPDMQPYRYWATEEFALNNEGDEVVLLDREDQVVDGINYGDKATLFAPAVPLVVTGQSLARDPAHCDSDTATDWLPLSFPSPGTITTAGECRLPPDPSAGLDLLPIGAIQGAGDVSPYLHEIVTFRGVVTGVQADQNSQGVIFYSLFVQDRPGEEDGDPATSDGIAVFLATRPPTFAPGDAVLVRGQVVEFFGATQIDHEGLEVTRLPDEEGALPEPVLLTAGMELEPYEGMLVALPPAVVVGPTHSACGFAVQSSGLAENNEPFLVLHHTDVDCQDFPALKVGDGVAGIAGPLTYHFERYKVVQQEPAELQLTLAPLPPFPQPPVLPVGTFSIASFNLQNHFDTEVTGGVDEPVLEAVQVQIKQDKLAHALHQALGCPTLVGIQEVETAALLGALADALAPACGFRYEVVHRESPDGRGIDLALLAQPGRVAVQDASLRQTCTPIQTDVQDPAVDCPAGRWPLFSRPPLQASITVDGQPFVLFVNHLKSKREGEAETAARRLAQAAHLRAEVEALLAADPQAAILVLGDFNDGETSATLQRLTEGDVLWNAMLEVPPAERYSYIYDGVPELLDGILLSPAARGLLHEAQIVHINAAYPAAWERDLEVPYASADHDVPLVTLAVAPPATPTPPTPIPTMSPQATATSVPPPAMEEAARPGLLWVWLPVAALGILSAGYLWWRRR